MQSGKVPIMAPRLSPFEFQELQRLFNDVAGLHIEESSLPLLERRLAARLPVHDLSTFRDYLRLLQFGAQSADEMAAACDLLTIGETYFFRHKEQLRLVADTILPSVATANAGSRRLTIWSAGCSSGEEAYTAAILLNESGLFHGWNVRVVGNDLSHERIELARQGCYFQGAFRTTEPHIRDRYFECSGKFWQIQEDIRRVCQFAPLNLLGRDIESFVGRVDIIFCRNVLIYLSEKARKRVIESLYERLVPGGFMLLGHSESLKFLNTPLELIAMGQELAFRKPGRGTRRGGDE
jgi:chemotaxis protein methyltransferase CheR